MRQDKLTTKFQQALGEAQSLALAHDNQYIEPVHLLLAVMNDQEGSASSLIERSGGNAKRVRDEAQAAVERLPKVTGTSGDVQVSRDLIRALNLTEKEAMQRGDIGVGHYSFAFGGDGSGLGWDLSEPVRFLELAHSLGVDLVCTTICSPYYNPHFQRPAYYPVSDGYLPPEDPVCGAARRFARWCCAPR